MKEMYIDRGITQSRVLLEEDGNILDFYMENHDQVNETGNIYKGIIRNKVSGLDAYFVDIGKNKNGILHYSDIAEGGNLKLNDEVLVQIMREDSGLKGARLTGRTSIPGKYIVLIPSSNIINLSKKITDEEERERLLRISQEIQRDIGFILRTEAQNVEGDILREEYNSLLNIYNDMIKKFKYSKSPRIVYSSRDFFKYILREILKSDVDRININKIEDGEQIEGVCRELFIKPPRILYNDYFVDIHNRITKAMGSFLKERFPLPSGGFLIVQSLEALTFIDVNSGSFTDLSAKDDTVLKTNIEACREIGRIVKLKNISGIIFIDFIDMDRSIDKQSIIDSISEEFIHDRAYSRIYGFTNLGILEMARAKKGKKVEEMVYRDKNRGEYTLNYILKEIENNSYKLLKHYNKKSFDVSINMDILEGKRDILMEFRDKMKEFYGIELKINGSLISNFSFTDDEAVFSIKDEKIKGKLLELKRDDNGDMRILFKPE